MPQWLPRPWHLLGVARNFWGWLKIMAKLGGPPERGLFEAAHGFLQEREAWIAIMNTIQFDEQGSFEILDGLAKRHGSSSLTPSAWNPDERLLKKLTPLIWFFDAQRERFPVQTVGHGCAVGLLHTLFRAAQPGATHDEVLTAVRDELDAQLYDACKWRGPGAGDLGQWPS